MRWFKVKVYFPAIHHLPEEIYFDEIQAFNPEHALKRACWNWQDAKEIKIIERRRCKNEKHF